MGSSATLGTNSTFIGHVYALTSITATTGATIYGQLLARDAAVTLDTNTIVNNACTTPVVASTTTAPGSTTTAPGSTTTTVAGAQLPNTETNTGQVTLMAIAISTLSAIALVLRRRALSNK